MVKKGKKERIAGSDSRCHVMVTGRIEDYTGSITSSSS